MANSDIIKIGFDYRASLAQFEKDTNGVFDGISNKAGKQRITIQLDAKDDKVIDKIKELQKLKLDKFTFEFGDSGLKEQLQTFDKLENKINEIINLGKGKSFIDSSPTVTDIGKIENKINELNKKYEEAQKKLSSIGSGDISGKDVNLVDNAEFQKLTQEVSKLKNQFDDLKIHIQLLDDCTVPTDRFFELQSQVEGATARVSDLVDEFTKLSNAQKVLSSTPQESNISSGSDSAIEQQNKFQEELKETQRQAEQTANSVNSISNSNSPIRDYWKKYGTSNRDSYITNKSNVTYDTIVRQLTEEENASKGIMRQISKFIDPSNIMQGIDTDYFKAVDQELQKIGYHLDAIQINEKDHIASAKILPIDDKAITNAEEMERILKNIQSSTTSQNPMNDAFPNADTKLDEAVTSAKDLDKTLEQVDIPTDSFDKVLEKLDRTKSELVDIVKITKQSVSDADGKFHDSYTLKDSRGSTEIYGVNSKTDKGQILRQNIVGYDVKKDTVDNSKELLAIEKQLQKEIETSDKANQKKFQDFQKEQANYEESVNKVNSAIQKTDEILDTLPLHDKLDGQFLDMINSVDNLNSKLKSGEFTLSEYKNEVKSVTSEYSKMVSIQQKRDVEDYKANAKANLENAKNIKAEWDKNLKAIQDYMDAVTKLNNLKAKDKGTGSEANQIALQTQNVEELKQAAWDARKNLSSMQAENPDIIAWKQWVDMMELFDQASKGSAESAAKLKDALNNIKVPSLDKYENKLSSYLNKTGGYDATIARFNDGGWTSDEYLKNVQAVRDAVKQYSTLLNNIKTNQNGIASDEDIQNLDKYEKKIKETIAKVTNMSASEKGYSQLAGQKEIDKINKILRENSAMSSEAKAKIKAYKQELISGNPSVSLEKIHGEIMKIVNAEELAGRAGRSMFDVIKEKAFYGFAAQIGMYFGFDDVINLGKEAISTIVSLDDALVDLKKTTTMNTTQLNEFYYSANDVARQTGATTEEIINQASAWSRLGYSSKESATEMAKLSSQFASISPGMDIDTATDGLVSTMKAFDVSVDEVQRNIMDNINKIGNTAATSNSEIVDMLTRSSAAMAAANNTLEETIALETAAVEITRSSESTGTAFKTLSMRLRGYDEETESYTGDVEELSGAIADLTKTASTPGGISLFTDDTKQTYKSTYQLLKEISEIWDQLSDKDQAQLLEKLAGKRGGQVVAGLLSNFSAAEKAMKDMGEAAGSSDAEMGIIEQSIEYKLNNLKEIWVGTAQSIVNRDSLGGAIDALSKLSEGISFVIKNFGLLKTAVIGLTGYLSFKNVGIFKQDTVKSWFAGTASSVNSEIITPFSNAEQIIYKYNQEIEHNSLTQQGWQRLIAQCDDGLASYLTNIKGSTASMSAYSVSLQGNITGYTKITQAMKQYNALGAVSQKEQQNFATAVSLTNTKLGSYLTGLNGAKASLSGYGVSLIASTAKTVGLTIATTALNAALTFGISAIITGVVSAFATWINSSKKITEAAEEAKDKISSINDDLKTNTETVENAKQRYAELAQEVENLGKVNQSRGSLSADEYKEFLDLSNQLAGVFPQLSKNYDENGNAILDLSGSVDTIVSSLDDLLQKEKDLANQKIMDEFPDVYKGYIKDLGNAQAEVKSAKAEFDKVNNAYQQLQNSGGAAQSFDLQGNGTFENADGEQVKVTLAEYEQALKDLGIEYEKTNIMVKNQFGGDTLSGYLINATGDIDTAFTNKLETAKKNLDYAKQQLEGETSSISSYLNTWLQTEFTYNQIDDTGLQTAVQDMIMNFDFSNLPENVDKDNWNEVSEYLRRNILFAINDVQDDPEISKAISEVFTNQDLTPDEKADYLKQIKDYFDNELGKDNAISIVLQPQIDDTEALQKSYDAAINRFKSDASDSSSKELDFLNKQLDEQTQSLADAKENLQNEYDKISDWGLDDYADQIKNNTIQTKFGNVDMDKRTIIHWSDELKHTYADALASWDYDPEIGSIDTVFGGSERFGEELNGNGWEVAFTPILPDGTFLSKDTVEEYINSILKEAYADDGKVTEDELTAIDAQGRQVGNTFVQGIFAGIDDSQNYDGNGNWAETVGRLMHFVGSFGAKQLADQGIDSANKKLEETKKKIEEVSKGFDDSQKIKDFFNTEGINTDEEINEFNEVTKGINDADKAIQKWNEHKKASNETPISFTDALNSSKYKDVKEKLLELAKAGQLTPYTISSTKEYNALLEDTGLSAEKAYKKIMKIAQSDMSEADWKTTLTNARSQIAEIKNLKKELKKNGESSDFMDTILEKFPQLIGYLGDQKGMQEQLNELQKEQEDVANNAYMHMVEDSESYYSTLKRKEAERLKTTSNTINKIVNGNAGLVKALGGYYKVDLSNYASIAKAKATLEKNLITNLASAWSKFYKVQVNTQTGLAEVHNDSTTVPSEYLEKANGDYGKAVSMMTKEQNKQKNSALKAAKAYNEAIKGFNSIIKNPGVSTNVSGSGGNSKSKKAKATYQKFSQTIDWCAQTLKKLSAQIDNVQAKLNNTSALSKQISYYKKLVKSQNELAQSYEKTENKYNKVYKNALKKLSKSDQKKVKDGSYTIEHFKGKAKSGKKSGAEKRYNNIQKALTARDNYLEASTSSENEKQKLAEYRESLASIRWENVTTKVEKLNNQISILDTRMSNVSGYVAKNKVLNEQLSLQKKIVDKQQEAYKANQKDANSYYKKISSKYKKNKNSDGAIKTTGIKDKKQLSYIKMYNAYLKQQKTNYVELKQAQEDYYNTIISAKQTAAENIKTDYDNRISLVDAKRQELESKASLAEANGQVVSGSYYKLIANNSNQKLEKLNAEKDKLEAQMQGVRKYSDLWYTLQANIISVDQSIADETKNAVDNINKQAEALKNLADAKNDYLNSTYDTLDWINSFADEDDYYDDDGNYTDKGYAVMHNKLAQIEIKKQESENYEKSISDLDKLYYSKNSKLSEAEWLKQRNELNKSYQQTQTDIYNQEKELADIRNKQLEQQSDKLKDIIDLKKKSLDADKSEYDYQKSISEKTKNIADLQKQLAMLEGNNSEDAMAERQKLQKELSDAKDDLKDTQYDKYLDRLEDAFADLEDRFDELIEEMKKEDVSTTTENIKTDVEDNNSSRAESGNKEILGENGLQVFDKTANSLITAGTNIETNVDDVNTKLDKIVEAVIKDSKEDVGNGNGTVKTTTDLDKVLGKYDAKNKSQDTKGKSSITKYLASQGYKTKSYEGMLDLVNGILNSDYVSGMNGDDRTALSKITTKDQLDGNKDKNATANKDLITKSLKYVKANEFISKNAIVGKKKRDEYSKANRHIYDKTGGKILSEKNLKKLAGILNVSYDSKKIYDALKACGYSQGGIVGKAIRVNGDDGIATLKTGEAVLTPAQTDALVALRKNLVPLNNFMSAIKTNVPNIQRATTATTTIGDVSFEFNLPNVVDSETLIKTIQTDTRVQKTLQNATVGQLNGSSRFKVNRL